MLPDRLPELLRLGERIHFRLGASGVVEERVLGALRWARSRGARRGSGPRGVVDPGEILDELEAAEAFGRGAQPFEVANVMVFLASDYSSYMTGETVAVSSQRA